MSPLTPLSLDCGGITAFLEIFERKHWILVPEWSRRVFKFNVIVTSLLAY